MLIICCYVYFQTNEKDLKAKNEFTAELESKVVTLNRSLHELEDKYEVLCRTQSNLVNEPQKTLL